MSEVKDSVNIKYLERSPKEMIVHVNLTKDPGIQSMVGEEHFRQRRQHVQRP